MIDIHHLTVEYPGKIKALNDFSCHISEKEHIALLGANGAGKSSLLQTLVGLLPVQSGSIHIGKTPLTSKTIADIRKKTGFLFQNPDDQLFCPNVEEDISFGPRNMRLNTDEVQERVNESLKNFRLESLRKRSPQRLSEGEKRRVALAGVLAMKPDILLFDEPTSQLDPRTRRELAKTINSLTQTCIIATHDLDFALETCRRAILLKNGELAALDVTASLLKNDALLTECGLR